MTSAAPATPRFQRRRAVSERVVEAFLLAAALLGVVTTVGIILVLVVEALQFFQQVSIVEYLTGTEWSALIRPNKWGVVPLVVSTLMIASIALAIGVPLGLLAAIYLAEYASTRTRTLVKPLLELIAGIPTIVLGFFAINFLAPNILKPLIPGIGTFSALAAGIVVGILVTPLIASLSEDAMRAVPRSLREGAFAMGATKFEVIRRVVLPAALSGIMASIILAMSRAVGETMAVVLAAGTAPILTFDPRDSVQTMTAFIVQISLGDTPADSIQFKALFAVGATLFLITLALNLLSNWFVARFRNIYD
ncbi:MAG TPA: phosphate ABC transporter permease subunit PstC [Candidatus Binatia bacterium]|nr:phosphate ABC transporter permease subunit PstC [Candidatus Binatia bacterium]